MSAARIANVLASRYASPEMADLWSAERKVILERELWIAVLDGQRQLGLDVEAQVIDDYRAVVDSVDLESIRERESVTLHTSRRASRSSALSPATSTSTRG